MTLGTILEGKADYVVYHDTYTSAVQEMERFITANKYVLDDLNDSYEGEQMAQTVGLESRRPKGGHTTKINLNLYRKRATNYLLQKKSFHAQVYNRGTSSNPYELNMYIL